MTSFILDNRKECECMHILLNLAVTLFFALFGAIYERFSHEVYSYYMIYAFAIPLVLGVLLFSIHAVFGRTVQNGQKLKRGIFFWNCGILTSTVGCTMKGILDIYGTTSQLLIVFPIAGLLLLVIGGICWGRAGIFRPCRRSSFR